jgi:D-tyrosyl-tRNA(Tyr) deacylase
MFKKYLIVASKKDLAGTNITTQLSQFGNFNFYLIDDEIVNTNNLDMTKINQHDFVIFASKHQSEQKEKTLSIHAPGNWRENKFGGEKGIVCNSSGLFQKYIFEKLHNVAKQHHLKNYKITMEATHHGPQIHKPCVFVEIGSTETEWKDRKAGFIVAKTIAETIAEFKENPYNEVVVAIGGPHYCPNFNKIQLKSNLAISHVIPKYCLPLTEEMMQEALAKTEEEVEFVLLDWKGIGNSKQRENIINILEKLYVRYKKISDVKY